MGLSSGDLHADLIERALEVARGLFPSGDRAEAEAFAAFLRRYYRRVASEDLNGRDPVDVAGAALAHWRLAANRPPGRPLIHVYNPDFDEHGWQGRHTAVDLVTDDMAFVVDSVTLALNRQGLGIHLVVHPVFQVRRDPEGRLQGIRGAVGSEGVRAESFVHVEVDRQTEPRRLEALARTLDRVLGDVRRANEDWQPMRCRLLEVVGGLEHLPPVIDDDIKEVRAFLQWLADDHFTFVGARDYELADEDGREVLRPVPGSGLGILREGGGTRPSTRRLQDLPVGAQRKVHEPRLLTVTKANAPSTVHRPTRLDYVGVKQFDESGAVTGERRFLGLFAATAYNGAALDIPLVGPKLRAVLDRADFPPGSHSEHELVQVLETYPRDELFQMEEDELFDLALGILQLQERRRVRLFARHEAFGRFVSCLVFLPRDRYTTETHRAMEEVLLDAFGGTAIDGSTTLVSESVLARLHVVVRIPPEGSATPDRPAVEDRLAEVTRSWSDGLVDALVEQCGEEEGLRLDRRWHDAFPAGYREAFLPRVAVGDIRRLEELPSQDGLGLHLYCERGGAGVQTRLKLFRSGGPLSLSDVLPHLQGMGVTVVDERPFRICPAGGPMQWIYDFGVRDAADGAFDIGRLRDSFAETFLRLWEGDIDSDGFNRLVLGAGIHWRAVVMLRAYAHYLRQIGSTFSLAYIEDTLVGNPRVARLLVELFHARLAPAPSGGAQPAPTAEQAPPPEPAEGVEQDGRAEREAQAAAAIIRALDDVVSLTEDRILRGFLALIQATVRTNWYQTDERGEPKPYLAIKLDATRLGDLPRPRPAAEVFVYSPRVEGVHLRAGRVSRGGIRWSDRREDYRTEVLGLMKAQAVKNAVIVPEGAKGGFVVKPPPAGRGGSRAGGRPAREAAATPADGVAGYRTFIAGLLDLTDNLVGGHVVPPVGVVRHDGDDPYLVVAADKGTATFSDVANDLALSAGYWLGDAFASGGSAGYDHKAMGITARGAWESVKRHLRVLGIDPGATDVTVVGIGDMSGDVFGNGLLLSRRLRLVAAFDHRHVFVDPDPDPEVGWAERHRLFHTPGSTWGDYDPSKLSAGGGVYLRTAKSIPLSVEARRALGLDLETGVGPLTPNEVIRAVLRAPVDLLWNGGVGTFVKARDEAHGEVGDKANDGVRVDAADLRCRVVAEGGNLGLTQRARIELARAGGRVNTDAVDNSAGVDCSDHEVNIKIVLDQVVAAGDLTVKQRNELLAAMTDDVARLVLADNAEQARALDLSLALAPARVDVHARYLRRLEQSGRLSAGERGQPGGDGDPVARLDRAVEHLPDDDELAARARAGEGLTAPELAVLLAYTKNLLTRRLLDSDVPEDPYLSGELTAYFPPALRRYQDRLAAHPLRREIIATAVANRTVNRAGITFVYRMTEETSAVVPDIIRAHTAASGIFGLDDLWDEIAALDLPVPAAVQTALLQDVRTLAERATRWLIHHRRPPLDVAATVTPLAEGAAVLAAHLGELVSGRAGERLAAARRALVAAGVPDGLAERMAGLDEEWAALDISEVAGATGEDITTVARAYFSSGEALELGWLGDRVLDLPRASRWEALARASLRDDLERVRAGLAAEVLRPRPGAGVEGGPHRRVADWLAANDPAVQRYRRVLGDVTGSTSVDLAVLSVVVREARNLIGTHP